MTLRNSVSLQNLLSLRGIEEPEAIYSNEAQIASAAKRPRNDINNSSLLSLRGFEEPEAISSIQGSDCFGRKAPRNDITTHIYCHCESYDFVKDKTAGLID